MQTGPGRRATYAFLRFASPQANHLIHYKARFPKPERVPQILHIGRWCLWRGLAANDFSRVRKYHVGLLNKFEGSVACGL